MWRHRTVDLCCPGEEFVEVSPCIQFEKSVTKIDIIDLLDDNDKDHDAPNKDNKPMTMHAADISCTEEDLTSITVYGRFIPENDSHSRTRIMTTATTT